MSYDMEFRDKQIAPPKSWEVFEDLIQALMAAEWENPSVQKNGRQGQAQHGVDVYGEHKASGGRWFGAQCKGKSRGYGSKATKREFDAELLKAEKFKPQLSRWIFATTAPNDGLLQKHVREVSTARQAAGKFAVDIFAWDTITSLLDKHPGILKRFYPEHVSQASTDLEKLDKENKAALASIDTALRHDDCSFSLTRPDIWEDVVAAAASSSIVRITGEGGSGKSALLTRLARVTTKPKLVIKENRVTAKTLSQHLVSSGVSSTVDEILEALTSGNKEAVFFIDGADRLLLSDRRQVVLDLLQALAARSDTGRFQLVTTARVFQNQDVVASALRDAGFQSVGSSVTVGTIAHEDAALIGAIFPKFRQIIVNDNVGEQNKSLFLLCELLRRNGPPVGLMTEQDLASAWVEAEVDNAQASARRSKALAEYGRLIVQSPARRPSRADLDPLGLEQLIAEGSAFVIANQDAVALAHDVQEDWLIARTFRADLEGISKLIAKAQQPLWWQRALRLVSQGLLEEGLVDDWLKLLGALTQADELDPAWARSVLVAPCYSEASSQIFPLIGDRLLEDDGSLLARLLETLLVFETRLDDAVLALPALANMDETRRFEIAGHLKLPVWRSWGSFLRWSLPLWRTWPVALIPRLSEIAAIFTRATNWAPNAFSKHIASIAAAWLLEIEDARHTDRWDDHREPFGLALPSRSGWSKVEARLRNVLCYCVASNPEVVATYLRRVTKQRRLEEVRRHLLSEPGRVPAFHAHEWVEMCLAQFLPVRRPRRRNEDLSFRRSPFSWHDFHDAGLEGGTGFHPSSPLRGGFDDLFASDEDEALRLFHRLERRAAVYWRWYSKCEDQKRPRPITVRLPDQNIQLWGDGAVYRWSQGVLGSHVLGSLYLALYSWLLEQAENGRPLAELLPKVLQQNGLIATAAVCISVIFEHINTEGAIDLAGPFLAELRLWDYDIRRHSDDQSPSHRIGFFSSNDRHLQAVEKLVERRSKHLPLSHTLLLPFLLKASPEARSRFDESRLTWTADTFAEFEGDVGNAAQREAWEARVERCRSDSDPANISFERHEQGVAVRIEPPQASKDEIEALQRERSYLAQAMHLAVWVERTIEAGEVSELYTLSDALVLANELASVDVTNFSNAAFTQRMAIAAIVGAAAVVVVHGDDAQIEDNREWLEDWLVAGASGRRDPSDEFMLVDEAFLSHDPQFYAAYGLAAYCTRAPAATRFDETLIGLAVQRLHGVVQAVLRGLRWSNRPQFCRSVFVAALDSCVIEIGRYWLGDAERRKAAEATTELRLAAAKRAISGRNADPRRPPSPLKARLVWTGKWPRLLKKQLIRSSRVLDWGRATKVLSEAQWHRLAADPVAAEFWASYLRDLIIWTRDHSEARDSGSFPFEWAHELARTLGRLAAASGRTDDWRLLNEVGSRYDDDLIGEYLFAVAEDMSRLNRAPDELFWSVWTPPADWVLTNRVPAERDRYDHVSHAIRAAGFVGPYFSPLPTEWPFLEDVLAWVDKWLRVTGKHPGAVLALLPVVQRMSSSQRVEWLVPWLEHLTAVIGSEESYWAHGSLGDKTAALLKPLAPIEEARTTVRKILGIIADAGSTVARELLPAFAPSRLS